MVNKKGWVRIIEAFVAVILIAGVIIYFYSTGIEKPKRGEEIYNFEKTALEQIASDSGLRGQILNNNPTNAKLFVQSIMPPGFIMELKICEINDICPLGGDYKQEVYSSERIITSTLTTYNPKKIKIFMWLEE